MSCAAGSRRLAKLTAGEVDGWLADRALVLSASSLHNVYGCLNRAVRRATEELRALRWDHVHLDGLAGWPASRSAVQGSLAIGPGG